MVAPFIQFEDVSIIAGSGLRVMNQVLVKRSKGGARPGAQHPLVIPLRGSVNVKI